MEASALELFLAQGFEGASIEQIAAKSDVARGTFYLYYPDKAAIFDALHERWSRPLLALLEQVHERLDTAQTPADALQVYQAQALGLAQIGLTYRSEILLAFREARTASVGGERLRERERVLLERVTELTALAAERGLIRAEDPRLVSLVVYGAVERLYYEYLIGDLEVPASVFAVSALKVLARTLSLPGA